jgi:hypothetical protein
VDERLIGFLDRGNLGICICAGAQITDYAAYSFTPLIETKTVFTMRPDNPLALHDRLTLDTLQDAVRALPPSGGTFRKTDRGAVCDGWSFPKRAHLLHQPDHPSMNTGRQATAGQ